MIDLCRRLYGDRTGYYLRWYHDKPLVITSARRDELRRLHAVLYRVCEHFALHWREWTWKYMPLSAREEAVLEMQERYPFRAGTFRPDYIIGSDGVLRICEITSRFFAHGIFMTYHSTVAGRRFLEGRREACGGETACPAGPAAASIPEEALSFEEERLTELLRHLLALTDGFESIYVFKSADKTSAIAMYKAFFESFGKRVTVLEADEVESRRSEWEGSFLISALNQKDLLGYSLDTLRAMVDGGIVNDMRTVLLLHDKRFLKYWFDDDFTRECLSAEDAAFLRSHAIATFGPLPADAEAFERARTDKDGWILKPATLGKSENVHAGVMTSPEEWESFFAQPLGGCILQPFVDQRHYRLVWEGNEYEEYICGMMLCLDDRYYDSGLVRSSSAPVTNKVDDRKMYLLHSDAADILAAGVVL